MKKPVIPFVYNFDKTACYNNSQVVIFGHANKRMSKFLVTAAAIFTSNLLKDCADQALIHGFVLYIIIIFFWWVIIYMIVSKELSTITDREFTLLKLKITVRILLYQRFLWNRVIIAVSHMKRYEGRKQSFRKILFDKFVRRAEELFCTRITVSIRVNKWIDRFRFC